MIVVNYPRLFRNYKNKIDIYARKISFGYYDDHAQEIMIYIHKHIGNFDPTQASLGHYIHILVLTAYRKIIFDRRKQEVFESTHSQIVAEVPFIEDKDLYNELIEDIVKNLNGGIEIAIFYSILYNKGEMNYTQISKLMNMNYSSFLVKVRGIRQTVREVLSDNISNL